MSEIETMPDTPMGTRESTLDKILDRFEGRVESVTLERVAGKVTLRETVKLVEE